MRIEEILEHYELETSTDCHIWQGRCTSEGYPVVSRKGIDYSVAQLIFAWANPKAPQPRFVRAACGNRRCTNPRHLSASRNTVTEKRRNRRKYTAEELQRLRSAGLSPKAIQKKLKISKSYYYAIASSGESDLGVAEGRTP